MTKEEIKELINIATKLKQINNNNFFVLKGMIIERNLNKKDYN